jgi:hypothetical protein
LLVRFAAIGGLYGVVEQLQLVLISSQLFPLQRLKGFHFGGSLAFVGGRQGYGP